MRGERSTGRGRGSGKTTWRRWPLWGDLSGERRTPSLGKDKMTEGLRHQGSAGCQLCPKETHFTDQDTETQRTQVNFARVKCQRQASHPWLQGRHT